MCESVDVLFTYGYSVFFCLVLMRGSYGYTLFLFFLMIRGPPRSTLDRSSAAPHVYKRQYLNASLFNNDIAQHYRTLTVGKRYLA